MRQSKAKNSIATRTGDDGLTTQLYGRRIPKTHPRIVANGSIDELSSQLGLAKAFCTDAARREALERIQLELIALMGEVGVLDEDREKYLASKIRRIEEADLARLDDLVDELETEERRFTGWVLAGTSPHQAALHVARAVCRRAERDVIALRERGETLGDLPARYLNRLSDVLWLLARD